MNIEYIELRVKLLRILKSLRVDNLSHDFYDLVSTNSLKDYLSISLDDPTFFSYTKNQNFVLDTARRNKCRIGSYLNKYLGSKYNDWEIDSYRNKIFNKLQLLDNAFHIVEGNDIVEAYKIGYAYHSCMTNTDSYKYTEFYAKNNVKMLKYDDNYYQARALIFQSTCGKTVLDRIYPNSGPHIQNIIEWAQKNNMWYRTNQGMPEYYSVEFTNGKDVSCLSISMSKNDVYPYLDSFSFTESIDDTIILSSHNNTSHKYCFRSTRGNYCQKCQECSRWTSLLVDNEPTCEDCIHEDSYRCRLCHNYITKGDCCANCE